MCKVFQRLKVIKWSAARGDVSHKGPANAFVSQLAKPSLSMLKKTLKKLVLNAFETVGPILMSCNIHSLCWQHGTLLHLCLVQQHCHRWIALPVGGANTEHQLQHDRAGISAGSEKQSRPEPPVGTHHRQGRVLTWLLSELGWVPHHGRCLGSSSLLQPHWLGLVSFYTLQ